MPYRKNPLISIVIPSWQQGKFLRYALESILSQSYSPIEIIVQDNLSTDNTCSILNEYKNKIQKIFIERDYGQAEALNKGFRRSSGDILGWLNADDMLMPNAITKVVEVFQSTDKSHIVYGHCANLNEFGQFLYYFNIIVPFSKDIFVNAPNLLAQTSTFFLRSCYFEVGGLDVKLKYTMDWDLWCKFAKKKYHFYFIDDVLSGARIYPDTKSKKGGLKRLIEIYRVNMLHKTTFFPLATIMYIYFDYLKPQIMLIRPLIRRLFCILCLHNNTFIRTFFRYSDLYLSGKNSEFIIKYPVYSVLSGTRAIIFYPFKNARKYLEYATLNNIMGSINYDNFNKIKIIWKFSNPTYFSAIELKFKLNNLKVAREDLKINIALVKNSQTVYISRKA